MCNHAPASHINAHITRGSPDGNDACNKLNEAKIIAEKGLPFGDSAK